MINPAVAPATRLADTPGNERAKPINDPTAPIKSAHPYPYSSTAQQNRPSPVPQPIPIADFTS
jgi:hypothetical protein